MMRNKIYLVGVFSIIITVLGCIFKLMHWPGAGILLIMGIFILSFLFLPAALFDSYKNNPRKNEKWLYFITGLIMSLNFIGALFKIMRWPYAEILLSIAITLPFMVLLPVYLFYNKIDKEINYRNFMAVFFFFAYFAVVSAILTVKPDKEIVKFYIDSNSKIEQTNNLISEYNSFPKNDTSDIIKKQAEKIIDNIQKIKKSIANENFYENNVCIKNDEFLNCEDSRLQEIKIQIVNYKNSLKNFISKESTLYKNLDLLIDTENSKGISWEKRTINNKLVITALNDLEFLKYQILFVRDASLMELK